MHRTRKVQHIDFGLFLDAGTGADEVSEALGDFFKGSMNYSNRSLSIFKRLRVWKCFASRPCRMIVYSQKKWCPGGCYTDLETPDGGSGQSWNSLILLYGATAAAVVRLLYEPPPEPRISGFSNVS